MPEDMKPKIVYFDKTVCFSASFFALHAGIGSGTIWVVSGISQVRRNATV